MNETEVRLGGQIPANPKVPCHGCGVEERYMTLKRSDGWSMEYLDDGSGEWIAYCPECDADGA